MAHCSVCGKMIDEKEDRIELSITKKVLDKFDGFCILKSNGKYSTTDVELKTCVLCMECGEQMVVTVSREEDEHESSASNR